jgi:hypothetical protein
MATWVTKTTTTTYGSDPVLDRITFKASPSKLEPIPWPEGLAPTKPAEIPVELPQADVLVVTYTAAEAQALADVLTPGHPSTAWTKYTTSWSEYEGQLTGRSPARESKCLGQWAVTTIGSKSVVLFKSDLHLATDATSLPMRQLWQQLITAVNPELVITTGTAGGIGTSTQLGDVTVTDGAKFNCRQAFKAAPFAQQMFGQLGTWTPGPELKSAADLLLPLNADRLKPIATRDPVINIAQGVPGVETVDYFGFADTDDSYGIVADDPQARTEEMDDAVLPLALELEKAHGEFPLAGSDPVESGPAWLSIRNASDPQVSSSIGDLEAQKKWASGIYSKYGYWTTVGSAIACWAVIADL